MNELPPIKPCLKWAGGKSSLLPVLASLYASHRGKRLVEPFCGALNVSLGLRPARALLNDQNPHLINFWKWVQLGDCRVTMRFDNDERRYYLCRAKFNLLVKQGLTTSPEAAQLFYYLNRTGFNGLCRFNAKGEFNVPKGSYTSIQYIRDFSPWAEALRRWDLVTVDFESITLKPDDWVYCDPPYDVPFVKYTADGFAWADQERLAHWLARHTGPAVASNQATPRILALYRGLGFQVQTRMAPRKISCNGDRTPAQEMLATKNMPPPKRDEPRAR